MHSSTGGNTLFQQMGLFDTVHCEYPLPDPRLQHLEFQTKDLECLLETYTITADGRLVRHARRGSGERAALDRDVEWPIHGDIVIYASDPDRDRGLMDIVVRFTHGRVEWARRLQPGESPRGMPPPQPWTITWPSSSPSTAGAALIDRDRGTERDGAKERDAEDHLLDNLRRNRDELAALLESCDRHWGAEDAVYRFYHYSFEVYALQHTTETIVERLRALAPQPEQELHPSFRAIVASGTGLRFEPAHNERWLETTRPIVEAFFHARYFLEMAVRYATIEALPAVLPSGWAALLCLYGLR
jgi:hypothetical protein